MSEHKTPPSEQQIPLEEVITDFHERATGETIGAEEAKQKVKNILERAALRSETHEHSSSSDGEKLDPDTVQALGRITAKFTQEP